MLHGRGVRCVSRLLALPMRVTRCRSEWHVPESACLVLYIENSSRYYKLHGERTRTSRSPLGVQPVLQSILHPPQTARTSHRLPRTCTPSKGQAVARGGPSLLGRRY